MHAQTDNSKKKRLNRLSHFLKDEKAGGIILVFCVVMALIIANSVLGEAYQHLLHLPLGITIGTSSGLSMSLLHWINDGLMAIFFFVVGLELKREFVSGELANPKKAALPIVAAIGGMIVPAVLYLGFNQGSEGQHGWGIPMATDIAFALGVLSLIGQKIPKSLKVFLTALAIVDDLGAVLVIAVFYTSQLNFTYLGLGMVCIGLMWVGNHYKVKSVMYYAILGILGAWLFFLLSGVHATVAAVLAAFMIPTTPIKESTNTEVQHGQENSLLSQLEHFFQPYVTFFILPIFAFTNAGVTFPENAAEMIHSPITWGVTIGLVGGKVIGITGFTLLAMKIKRLPFPEGMNLPILIGTSFLGAIGFTMSLFITSLAFDNELFITQAKIGIFIASLAGGLIGYFIVKYYVNRLGKSPTT